MIITTYRFATKYLAAILCMAVFLVGYTSNSLANDNELRDSLLSCSNVENNAKRLECVDKLILSIKGRPIVEATMPLSPQEPITEKSPINDSGGNEPGQKDPRKSQNSIAQTSASYDLVAAYKDNKKRWNFEFENGEVWRQIEPRYLPKVKNLPVRVSISKGVFGSHDLRAENFGKPVKVKRIN